MANPNKYVLPDLRWDYDALEPHLSGRIIELHHDKHHRAYVQGANQALEQLDQARAKSDYTRIAQLERALAFNLSGHVLHSLYWQNLAPDGGDRPAGELAKAIGRDFGGFDSFKSQLVQVAATIMGSGWAALCWDPVGRRLVTAQIHDHQSEITQAGLPIMVIDAWEHAYYLQYFNEKAKYFDAIWNLWNWSDVADRFARVRGVDLRLGDVVELGSG
jgi:Fe-Mn family superoxide dismutase